MPPNKPLHSTSPVAGMNPELLFAVVPIAALQLKMPKKKPNIEEWG